MVSLLGKMPTESVRRRISLLRRSWGLLDQICLHTSTGKVAVGQQVGSHGVEVVSVKPRVLWRLVYLVPAVAGCDRSWLFWLTSGTQAASCSAGVRIPIAE